MQMSLNKTNDVVLISNLGQCYQWRKAKNPTYGRHMAPPYLNMTPPWLIFDNTVRFNDFNEE